MARECYFKMVVSSEDEVNLKEFISIMEGVHKERKVMKRVYDVFPSLIEKDGDLYKVSIEGYCAYSVNTAMLDDEDSDYREWNSTDSDVTNLEIESKNFDLKIEVYSEEMIKGIEEHLIVEKGEVSVYELREVSSYYDDEIGDYVREGGFGAI